MSKFGDTAVCAAKLLARGKCKEPDEAWKQAVAKICASSDSMQKKCCPKIAFRGLCDAGLVKNVLKGCAKLSTNYNNANYAIKATKLLKKDPSWAVGTIIGLWREVAPQPKSHDQQMNVVLALWKNDQIVR